MKIDTKYKYDLMLFEPPTVDDVTLGIAWVNDEGHRVAFRLPVPGSKKLDELEKILVSGRNKCS
ncbi:MAG: hypothetical protein GY861_25755 [bacterium]|nr:hypothetical protein [bacterium]